MSLAFDGVNHPRRAIDAIDHTLDRVRRALMSYPGEVQAGTMLSAIAGYAARHMSDSLRCLEDLADMARYDLAGPRPAMTISRKYTNQDAMALVANRDSVDLVAGLSTGLVEDLASLERLVARVVGRDAAFIIMRRLLASVLKSLPLSSVNDAIHSLWKESMAAGSDRCPITVPLPEKQDASGMEQFLASWARIMEGGWSRTDYVSLVRSAIATSAIRAGLDLALVARAMSEQQGDHVSSLAKFAGWHALPDAGLPSEHGIVDAIGDLSDAISAYLSGHEPLPGIASLGVMLSPLSAEVVGQGLARAGRNYGSLLQVGFGPDSLLLLLKDAPAAIASRKDRSCQNQFLSI